MTEDQRDRTAFFVGPVWRDANVRSGPSLDSQIIDLLLPDDTNHQAVDWVVGDEVVERENLLEGEIVSDIWFRLSTGGWCSAVNFSPATVRSLISADNG